MNSAASLRCICIRSIALSRCLRRQLHSSKKFRQRSDYPKIIPKTESPRKEITRLETTADDFPPYTAEEKEKLKTIYKYTPAQLAAIEIGEAAIDPKDLAEQAALREDPFAFEYYDDFATILPVVDKPVRAPEENYDPKLRYKTEDEIAEDFVKFIEEMPEDSTKLDYMKFKDNLRLTVGKEEAERNPVSSLAPAIPKGIEVLNRPGMVKSAEGEIDAATKRLMRQTGFSLDEIRKFRVKTLVVHRVVNQTRMGKVQSIYYLTVAGNMKGLLGIGEGKSTEAEDAKKMSQHAAIRNLQPIPRYEDRTIYGDVKVKMGAVELELMTRPPGMPLTDDQQCQDGRLMSKPQDLESDVRTKSSKCACAPE